MSDNNKLQDILKVPEKIEDLEIPESIILDIMFRLLYNEGNVSFKRFRAVTRIPHEIIDDVLNWMRSEHLVDIPPSDSSLGRYGYIYTLTDAGEKRAQAAMDRSHYVGPAPVPIPQYNEAIKIQTKQKRGLKPKDIKEGLKHLILPSDFHRRVGPAANSGASLFLYGPSGNGKTTIAQVIANLISETNPIWLPYALTAGGKIIQIHDRLIHKEAGIDKKYRSQIDGRWGHFYRPSVVVGGELKLDALDLRFDPVSKIYEAPLQLKSNGGMMLVDDFGRQQVRPTDLLNRWIVPLEENLDYLRLTSGQTVVIPFRQFLVFSTNLDPDQLADDAFYRRIQMKVEVSSPNLERFQKIFLMSCKQHGIPYDNGVFAHLVEKWYKRENRTLQAVHPRDLIRIVRALCEYEGISPQLTPDLIDHACLSYFVG